MRYLIFEYINLSIYRIKYKIQKNYYIKSVKNDNKFKLMSIYIKAFVEDSSNCYKGYAKTRHTKRRGVSKEMIIK